jgi:hypothetical protein
VQIALEALPLTLRRQGGVIYTDTTIDTWTLDGVSHQLPELVLAYEQ